MRLRGYRCRAIVAISFTFFIIIAITRITDSPLEIIEALISKSQGDVDEGLQGFRDEVFAPLLEAYKSTSSKLLKTSPRSEFIPKFLLIADRKLSSKYWAYQLSHITKNECPLPCSFTENIAEVDSVNAVVFYLKNLKHNQMSLLFPERNLTQPWIMLSFEAPRMANSKYRTKYKEFNGLFNRTMMFRKDADIIVPHGYIVSKRDAKFLPGSWIVPSPPNATIRMKSRKLAIAFISHCRDFSGRLNYVKELQLYAEIDLYGSCGTLTCGKRMYVEYGYNVTTHECFKMAADNYLFYLSFENSLCKDYVTEKLYNILYYPLVPVVFGASNYSSIMPPHSYINALEYTPKALANYLLKLQANYTLYSEYLEWRKLYQVSTFGGVRTLCHLCVKLHDPSFYKTSVVEDFNYWFNTTSKCWRRWTADMSMDNRLKLLAS